MVARHKEELSEVQEKNKELERARSSLVNESSLLSKDLESAKGRIDELLTEEGRM
jgi:chromosome segregation ATPase